MVTEIRIGTRGSTLARAQTALAAAALRRVYPALSIEEVVIRTTGDQQTDQPLAALARRASGLFTSALEVALLDGRIDLAVHSAKDLPTDLTPGLVLAALLPRASVSDALISRGGQPLQALPQGAMIGTSSPRRAAQLQHVRPDLAIRDLRGNIDTRLSRALDAADEYDAIVLARAGLERLNRAAVITQTLPLETMLPAPAQGAIALQVRDTAEWRGLLAPLDDHPTHAAVTAERAFLRGLGGGCALPAAAYAEVQGTALALRGRVLTRDGRQRLDAQDQILLSDVGSATAEALGEAVAAQVLTLGAAAWIEGAR